MASSTSLTTFPKPKKDGREMKYTEMAIYIDAHIQDVLEVGENPDIETAIYIYMYHIYYALSSKAHFFKNIDDYDKYALYAAAQTFITMRDRWAHAGEMRGNKVVEPIKSSLNYIKTLLYPFKVNYQQQEFAEVWNPEENPKQQTDFLDDVIKDDVQSSYNHGLSEAFIDTFKDISIIIKRVLWNTPYKHDKITVKRLYFSCLLSLISCLTLSKGSKKLIERSVEEDIALVKQININNRRKEFIILWRLPEIYTDYVRILLVRIKHKLGQSLGEVWKSFDLDESTMDAILKTAYSTYEAQDAEGD